MRTALIFLVLIAITAATTTAEQFEEATEASPLEVVKDWRILSIMALIISIILVAIAYGVGIGFDMVEIKAWANTELVQIVANAVIIAFLIGTIAFAELAVFTVVVASGIDQSTVPACYGTDPEMSSCLQGVTEAYLQDHLENARTNAENLLRKNMEAARIANMRFGLQCITIFCLQVGLMMTWFAHYLIKSEMYMIVFEYNSNLLSSIQAQLFFVREICFNMGPVLLALGVVGRSFFFTRKLGGLLIATAAGLMFFFPAMYVFDWMTLDMAINGDKGFGDGTEEDCPAECQVPPPIAVVSGSDSDKPDPEHSFKNIQELADAFAEEDKALAQEIMDGGLQSAQATNPDHPAYGSLVKSCYYGSSSKCPSVCRELPYPASSACVGLDENNDSIQEFCSNVAEDCKVVREVEVVDQQENSMCPDACKVIPPLKSDCDDGDCLSSSLDCRVTKQTDLYWRPSKDSCDDCSDEVIEACDMAADCVPDANDAYNSCTYVLPETGSCEELCAGCNVTCRIGGSGVDLPSECEDWVESIVCSNCYEGCKARWEQIELLDEKADEDGMCSGCPLNHRIVGPSLPNSYIEGDCSVDNCPVQYRVVIPHSACDMCIFSDESYIYDPPINAKCTELCKPATEGPASDPSAFSKIGAEGLVGEPEIQAVSKMMIPAYVLPLFNIVATLMFIKGLSAFLGGDIEIPGLSKVF